MGTDNIEIMETDQPATRVDEEQSDVKPNRHGCSPRGVLIVAAGCIVHLTLGTLYTYANLSSYMISYIRRRSSPEDLRYVDGIWVQACMMIGQGVTMFTGGILERRLGPRITTLIGSWTLSVGVLLTYFAMKHSYIATVITFGAMPGLGTGVAYPIPIACAMRWIPERRGLVSAVIIAGFGSGVVVFNQVITAFINPNNYSPDTEVNGEMFFSQDDLLDKVPFCFLLLGGTYSLIQLICCSVIVDPPKQEDLGPQKVPDNGTVDQEGASNSSVASNCPSQDYCKKNVREIQAHVEDFSPLQALRTKNFYLLWLIFLCGGEGMVFISSQYKNYGQTFIADDLFHATVGSVSSVVSAVGCIFWGMILDRFTFKITAGCIYAGFSALIISFIGSEYGGKPMFFIWVCLFFFFFAGIFTIMPPVISKLYGNTYLGVNFGLLFTSQIITGATSAFLGQILKDLIGWHGLFYLSTGFSALGFILVFIMEAKSPDGSRF